MSETVRSVITSPPPSYCSPSMRPKNRLMRSYVPSLTTLLIYCVLTGSIRVLLSCRIGIPGLVRPLHQLTLRPPGLNLPPTGTCPTASSISWPNTLGQHIFIPHVLNVLRNFDLLAYRAVPRKAVYNF